MAAGVVHVPWYATGFRGDELQAELERIAAISVRYGATGYQVFRARDDRYKLLQVAHFEDKLDWERYWYGPEFTDFRVFTSGWYQVPVVYGWHDLVVDGRAPSPNGDRSAAMAVEGESQ